MNDARLRQFFTRHLHVNQWTFRVFIATLIVLKAFGVINTPWLVVLAPLWAIPALIALTWAFVIALLVLAVVLRPWLR